MESNFLKGIDNKYGLLNEEAIVLIDNLMKENLSNFILVFKFSEDAYFEVKYEFKNILIVIGSGRANIEYNLKINGKDINLLSFDKDLKNIITNSEKNIIYVIKVIRDYLVKNYERDN